MVRLLVYLFNLIVVTIIGWIIARLVQRILGRPAVGTRGPGHAAPRRTSPPTISGTTARDPVCGMFVSTELSLRLVCGGETLHFCSRECLERFQTHATKS
jgi:YHS domain-containing protein